MVWKVGFMDDIATSDQIRFAIDLVRKANIYDSTLTDDKLIERILKRDKFDLRNAKKEDMIKIIGFYQRKNEWCQKKVFGSGRNETKGAWEKFAR